MRLSAFREGPEDAGLFDAHASMQESSTAMLAVFSVALVIAGACLAYVSRDFPNSRRLLEGGGGVLLVLGLVALGFAFPFSD
jgi:hypothetical protein